MTRAQWDELQRQQQDRIEAEHSRSRLQHRLRTLPLSAALTEYAGLNSSIKGSVRSTLLLRIKAEAVKNPAMVEALGFRIQAAGLG